MKALFLSNDLNELEYHGFVQIESNVDLDGYNLYIISGTAEQIEALKASPKTIYVGDHNTKIEENVEEKSIELDKKIVSIEKMPSIELSKVNEILTKNTVAIAEIAEDTLLTDMKEEIFNRIKMPNIDLSAYGIADPEAITI